MSEALTLARPYARAAFEMGSAAGSLEQWSVSLSLAAGIASDARVKTLLNDPRVSNDQLISLHAPEGVSEEDPFACFLGELIHYDRLGLLPEIHALFESLKREAEKTLKVTVTSAMEMDPAQTDQLQRALNKRFASTIEMDIHVNPDLLGGVIIDAGDEVIDGSVRGRIDRMANMLSHG